MKILICGAGAIGSNLVGVLAPDLKGEHEIIVLDKDVVEERNIEAGTQFYMPDQVGLPKVEALQFNIYKQFQREIEIMEGELKIISKDRFKDFNLVIDCFDNEKARNIVYTSCKLANTPCLHIGFSANFTFAIEWNGGYKVPTDIKGLDICQMPGAAAFVKMVAAKGALVAEEYINGKISMDIVGGKFSYNVIK